MARNRFDMSRRVEQPAGTKLGRKAKRGTVGLYCAAAKPVSIASMKRRRRPIFR